MAELALRFLVPLDYLRAPQPLPGDVWRELLNRRSEIPGLNYELRPDVEKVFLDVLVRTNTHGMRDRERMLAKAPGVFRIAVVGDSFTFGFGVENEQTYPSVLEALLNGSARSPHYEVLNFGVGGYSTHDEALVLRHRVMAWDPDLILVGYVSNDPETDPIQPLHAYFHRAAWWQHVAVLRLGAALKNLFDIHFYGGGSYVRYLHSYPPKWQTVVGGFRDMHEVAAEHDVAIALAILDCELHEKVAATATQTGLIPLATHVALAVHPREQTRQPDGHPTQLGHRLIAEAIRDELRRRELVPSE